MSWPPTLLIFLSPLPALYILLIILLSTYYSCCLLFHVALRHCFHTAPQIDTGWLFTAITSLIARSSSSPSMLSRLRPLTPRLTLSPPFRPLMLMIRRSVARQILRCRCGRETPLLTTPRLAGASDSARFRMPPPPAPRRFDIDGAFMRGALLLCPLCACRC